MAANCNRDSDYPLEGLDFVPKFAMPSELLEALNPLGGLEGARQAVELLNELRRL